MSRKPVDPFKPNPRHGNGYISNYVAYKEVVAKPMLATPGPSVVTGIDPTGAKLPNMVCVESAPELTCITDMYGKVLVILNESLEK
jgi:hypothetical protein